MPKDVNNSTPVNVGTRTVVTTGLVHDCGQPKLEQLRAKIASDMSHTPVLIEDAVLLDQILALPPGILSRPERKTCPFTDLAGANGMEEAQVSALFVGCISFMNQGLR